MYNALIDKKFERPYAEKLWERKLNLIMTKEDWERVNTMNTKRYRARKLLSLNIKSYLIFCHVVRKLIDGIRVFLFYVLIVMLLKIFHICYMNVFELNHFGSILVFV